MKNVVQNISSIPLYEQIKNQIIDAILNDRVKTDQKLPSNRALARDLKVSVITTRVYKELEDLKYINTVQGIGIFVIPKNDEIKREALARKLDEVLYQMIELQQEMNISDEELFNIITALKETV